MPPNGLQGAITDTNCYLSTDRIYDIVFEPIDGTQSTLVTDDAQGLYLSDLDNGYLSIAGDGQAQPVTHYTLTTCEGFAYRLNQSFGIEQVTDPNGHTLTYSSTGITHSSGKAVTFSRDTQGRITRVTDPTGNAIVYSYNGSGDLTAVTDRAAAQTSYT
jgi:YD repeat-containing protein